VFAHNADFPQPTDNHRSKLSEDRTVRWALTVNAATPLQEKETGGMHEFTACSTTTYR
jgi:hypothetical protein